MSLSANTKTLKEKRILQTLQHPPPLDGFSAAVFGSVGVDYLKRALRIDQVSRVLFPLTFVLFVTLYWLYYMGVFTFDDLAFWQYF